MSVSKAFLALHTLLAGAIFGFFYSFSILVMPGLDLASPDSAVNAMNAINSAVRTPMFAPAFFGPPLTGVLTALLLWRAGLTRASALIVVATLIYIVGDILPTIAYNVPMNRELMEVAADLDAQTAQNIWSDYSSPWQFWNNIRTLSSGLALMFSIGALLSASTATSAKD